MEIWRRCHLHPVKTKFKKDIAPRGLNYMWNTKAEGTNTNTKAGGDDDANMQVASCQNRRHSQIGVLSPPFAPRKFLLVSLGGVLMIPSPSAGCPEVARCSLSLLFVLLLLALLAALWGMWMLQIWSCSSSITGRQLWCFPRKDNLLQIYSCPTASLLPKRCKTPARQSEPPPSYYSDPP